MITAVDVVLRELPPTPVRMKGRTRAVFSEQNATAMAAVPRLDYNGALETVDERK